MKRKVNKYVIFIVTAFFVGSLFPFAYSGVDNGLDQLKIMVDVMAKIEDSYVDETQPKELITNALYGMVNNLDEFSEFINITNTKRIKEETRGEFGGVGLRLIGKEGELYVVTPLPKSPAYKAGIEPGDEIIQVNDKLVKDIPSQEAIDMMRGAIGEKVTLVVKRKDDKKKEITKKFVVKKAKIIPQVVYPTMLENKIGYIYIEDFSGHTVADVKTALADFKKQGMESLILDLRFNPGGTLDSAIDLAKLFIGDNKMIVYTKGRKEAYFKEYKSNKDAPYADLPIVLLVNEGSASGSEIVAGALQDHERALLIGARTFGKGSVQQVSTLEDGSALKLTVAKYYTPLGRMIHRDFKKKGPNTTGGILPDIEVKTDLAKTKAAILQRTTMIYSPSKKTAKLEGDPLTDEQLDRAKELLKARKVLGTLNVKEISAAEKANKQEVKEA